jgi:hypothetical protein
MKNSTLGEEIFSLEKKYWDAMQVRDIETMLSLSDEQCIVVGAQGVACLTKESLASMMQTDTYTLKKFKLSDDYQVKILNEDVVVVAYKVTEELLVGDQTINLEASDSSTWVRRGGAWVCAMHSEAIAGDPFGRDRVQYQQAS